jgi:CheY-like chemotaxis protein
MATVLIVDDEPSLRRLVGRVLTQNFDVTCLEAPDGAAAMTELHSTPVDVVVLDLDMPVMDGLETLEAIRQTPALRATPVVMVTGRPAEERIRAALNLGLATVLLKPFSTEALCARVRPILAARARSNAIERRKARRLTVGGHQTLLIVECDAQLRQLLVSTFGHAMRVREAESEFVAMSTCATSAPDVVWLGETSGVWSREQLRRAIAELPQQGQVAFVASLPKDELAASAASGHYTAVIRRTTDLAELETEVLRVFDPHTSARILLRPDSPAVQAMFRSLGELGLTIVPAGDGAAVAGRHVSATALLNVANVGLALTFRVPVAGAIELASQRPEPGADRNSHELALGSVKSLAEMWAQLALTSLAIGGLGAELEQVGAHWVSEPVMPGESRTGTARLAVTNAGVPMRATIATVERSGTRRPGEAG